MQVQSIWQCQYALSMRHYPCSCLHDPAVRWSLIAWAYPHCPVKILVTVRRTFIMEYLPIG